MSIYADLRGSFESKSAIKEHMRFPRSYSVTVCPWGMSLIWDSWRNQHTLGSECWLLEVTVEKVCVCFHICTHANNYSQHKTVMAEWLTQGCRWFVLSLGFEPYLCIFFSFFLSHWTSVSGVHDYSTWYNCCVILLVLLQVNNPHPHDSKKVMYCIGALEYEIWPLQVGSCTGSESYWIQKVCAHCAHSVGEESSSDIETALVILGFIREAEFLNLGQCWYYYSS